MNPSRSLDAATPALAGQMEAEPRPGNEGADPVVVPVIEVGVRLVDGETVVPVAQP